MWHVVLTTSDPDNRKISFVPRWPAASRRAVQVRRFQLGNLSAVRDFSDVRDIVRAYRLIIERRPSQKYVLFWAPGTAFPFDVSLTTRWNFLEKKFA